MNTVTEITVSVPRSVDVKTVWRSVDSLLARYEKRFSVSGEGSEVLVLNERVSQSLPISYELGEMLRVGLAWGDSLDGAFDITILPLKELWGFCEECTGEEPLPDSNQVSATLQNVNYKKIRLSESGDSVYFDSPDIRVDVGGIAKGFALRRLGERLKSFGIDNFLISAGGDILASGHKRTGGPWRVGVRHPRQNSELLSTMETTGGATVTSGDYERARVVDDVRYHHIFDPKTGYSCESNQSLTIISKDPVTADVLSTGLFCRSAKDILTYTRARDGIECIVVDSTGNVFSSHTP